MDPDHKVVFEANQAGPCLPPINNQPPPTDRHTSLLTPKVRETIGGRVQAGIGNTWSSWSSSMANLWTSMKDKDPGTLQKKIHDASWWLEVDGWRLEVTEAALAGWGGWWTQPQLRSQIQKVGFRLRFHRAPHLVPSCSPWTLRWPSRLPRPCPG